MKKLLLALAFLLIATPCFAQNTTCSDRPSTDVSNACANTRFTHGAITTNCIVFTSIAKGCVPASGGGTTNFLRADGTFAPATGSVGEGLRVASVIMWSGATLPDRYLYTAGQAVDRATYPDLLNALTIQATIFCTLTSPTITVSTDISDKTPIGAPIEASACFNAGTTVSSKSSGSLTLSTNAIATTSTTMSLFPYGNGNGSTTFNVPDYRGRIAPGRDNMLGTAASRLTTSLYGANPDAVAAAGGAQSRTLVTGNLPAYTPSGSVVSIDAGHFHSTTASVGVFGIVVGGGAAAGPGAAQIVDLSTQNTSISQASVSSTFTGNAQGGSSTPFAIVQPSLTSDYIIKALPDDVIPDSGITIGGTNINGGTNGDILTVSGGKLSQAATSTANQYNCATAGSIVTPDVVYQAETTTTYGTTTTFDFCIFKNTKVTLTGNITTMTLSNVVAGKAGMITFIQDGTGSRTTVWNSILKFSGGIAPTLSTTAGAVDILTYACRSATFCGASLLQDVK